MPLDGLHVDGLDGVAAAPAQAHHVLAHPAGGARERRGPQVQRRLRLRLGVLRDDSSIERLSTNQGCDSIDI